MATLASSAGFYKAPVTKGVLGTLAATSLALQAPFLYTSHLRGHFIYNFSDVLVRHQFWRVLASRLAFVDVKDLVFGSLLLYYFRVFEKRFGSRNFASFILVNFVVTSLLEGVSILFLREVCDITVERLPSGPFCLIFPLFVSYFLDIPGTSSSRFLGFPITEKNITYLIGLQVLTSSRGTLVSAASGIVSGLIWRNNVFHINNLQIPQSLCNLAHRLCGWLIESNAPEEFVPMGATLEIQRVQQMEQYEREMMRGNVQDLLGRNIPLRGRRPADNGASASSLANVQNNLVPEESHVQTLTEMGFERDRVVTALLRSNNDLNAATNFLLSGVR